MCTFTTSPPDNGVNLLGVDRRLGNIDLVLGSRTGKSGVKGPPRLVRKRNLGPGRELGVDIRLDRIAHLDEFHVIANLLERIAGSRGVGRADNLGVIIQK